MQAIILAAGEGRRLRPLTAHRPKVMIPVGGRPVLEHVVDALVQNGITDITMVVGYHRERIQTRFQDGKDHGAQIRYAVQQRQLGTGHALATGLEVAKPDAPFLVLPGDNWVTPELVRALIDGPGDDALVTTRSANPSKYGVVRLEGDRISAIEEKPLDPRTRLISTGIYRFGTPIIDYVGGDEGLALTDAVNRAINDGRHIAAVATEDSWHDIVYPWDLLRINHHVLGHMASHNVLDGADRIRGEVEEGVTIRGPCRIGKGSHIRSGTQILGPVWIGEHVDIGPNTVIRGPAAIGDHVHIGPFNDLENVTIHDEARVDTGGVLRHVIVDTGAQVGPRISADRGPSIFDLDGDGTYQRVDELGAVIGKDAQIGANVVLAPGSVIGAHASVAANRTVDRVPDHAQVV